MTAPQAERERCAAILEARADAFREAARMLRGLVDPKPDPSDAVARVNEYPSATEHNMAVAAPRPMKG